MIILTIYLVGVLSLGFARMSLIDESSIIARSYASDSFRHMEGKQENSFNLNAVYDEISRLISLGQTVAVNDLNIVASKHDENNRTTKLNIGLYYHFSGDYDTAVIWYKSALSIVSRLNFREDKFLALKELLEIAEIWFSLGVSYQYSGKIVDAGEAFYQAIHRYNDTMIPSLDNEWIRRPHYRAYLNYAALHHAHGSLDDAITHYKELLYSMDTYENERRYRGILNTELNVETPWNMLTMTKMNLGAALIQSDRLREVSLDRVMVTVIG